MKKLFAVLVLLLVPSSIWAWGSGLMVMGGNTEVASINTSAYINTGTYTGNNTDDRVISGVGFTPQLVIIAGSSVNAAIKLSSMPSDTSGSFSGTTSSTNGIQALGAGSFTVGTDANVNGDGVTYYWLAMAKNSDSDFYVGTYTGNNTDNRNFTDGSMGFTPDFVMGTRFDLPFFSRWTTTIQAGDASFSGNAGPYTDFIQDLISNGFQLGSSGYVNANAVTYYYVAIKAGDNIKIASFTGDGNDDKNITGIGWQPDWITFKRSNDYYYIIKEATTAASDSGFFLFNAASASNTIQNLNADGFQVGNSIYSNVNAVPFFYMVLQENTP